MRALAVSRFFIFVTRRSGAVELVAARATGFGLQGLGRRVVAPSEAEPILLAAASAGVEIVETPDAEVAALPAGTRVATTPKALAATPRPVESPWVSFSEIVLKTHKIRGPNAR